MASPTLIFTKNNICKIALGEDILYGISPKFL